MESKPENCHEMQCDWLKPILRDYPISKNIYGFDEFDVVGFKYCTHEKLLELWSENSTEYDWSGSTYCSGLQLVGTFCIEHFFFMLKIRKQNKICHNG